MADVAQKAVRTPKKAVRRTIRTPVKAKGGSKYHAVRTSVGGIHFDSQKEARRFVELKALEKAGKIHRLAVHPKFMLCTWHSDHACAPRVGFYIADFEYCTCDDQTCLRFARVVEDVKGVKTQLYRWKKRHFEAQYQIQIREL